MKNMVVYFWGEIMRREEKYRVENFDIHVQEDLAGLAKLGKLAQKRYPFPMMQKPELSCRMFVDHAGVNYWKVREQVRAAMLYFRNGSKGSGRCAAEDNIGKTMCVVEKLIVEFW